MILEGALELHGKIAPPANQPLHRRLVEVLYQNSYLSYRCVDFILVIFESIFKISVAMGNLSSFNQMLGIDSKVDILNILICCVAICYSFKVLKRNTKDNSLLCR